MSKTSRNSSSENESDTVSPTPELSLPDFAFDKLSLETSDTRATSSKELLQTPSEHCDTYLLKALGLSSADQDRHYLKQSQIMSAVTVASSTFTFEVGFETRASILRLMEHVEREMQVLFSVLPHAIDEEAVNDAFDEYRETHDTHGNDDLETWPSEDGPEWGDYTEEPSGAKSTQFTYPGEHHEV